MALLKTTNKLLKGNIADCPDITPFDKKRTVKEYGDVRYADPKNKKYPLDTEEHVRAAFFYFSMPKNREKYKKEVQDAIMDKIHRACEKHSIEFPIATNMKTRAKKIQKDQGNALDPSGRSLIWTGPDQMPNTMPIVKNMIVKKMSLLKSVNDIFKSNVKGHYRTTKSGKRVWVKDHTDSRTKKTTGKKQDSRNSEYAKLEDVYKIASDKADKAREKKQRLETVRRFSKLPRKRAEEICREYNIPISILDNIDAEYKKAFKEMKEANKAEREAGQALNNWANKINPRPW